MISTEEEFFFIREKKILITGASGFLGRYLSIFLKELNAELFGIDINPSDSSNLFREFIVDNINTNSLEKLFNSQNFDFVFHLAGSASVPFSIQNPIKDYESIVPPTLLLINFIKIKSPNTRLITFSSAAVYGSPKSLPIKETYVTNPISPYGLHKEIVEKLICYYANFFKIKCDVLRVFSAYGNGLKKQIFWDVLKRYKSDKNELKLFGTGFETRDYIHAKDIVRASLFIAKQKKSNFFELYNIASGKETTILKAIGLLFENLDTKPKIYFEGNNRKGDPVNWKADVSKLKSTGFSPKFELENELPNYFDWFLDNSND